MEGPVRGEVVILEFPFSDLIQSKRRPSLIIKVPKGDDVIVCQITGMPYEKSVEIPIKINPQILKIVCLLILNLRNGILINDLLLAIVRLYP